MRAGDNMAEEMDIVPPDYQKTRRSMSIHSICDPLASSISTLSDHDSEATLIVTDRVSIDGDPPKYDSLSPSEEQAVRALEDLRAGMRTFLAPNANGRHRHVAPTKFTGLSESSTRLLDREFSCQSMGSRKELQSGLKMGRRNGRERCRRSGTET